MHCILNKQEVKLKQIRGNAVTELQDIQGR